MKKMMMTMIIGCCLAVFTAGSVFAEDSILAKQKEIDQYVVQHKEDIAAKGITVTTTAPQDGYVEVAITPYNDANAEYLYGIFGKDKVKVVEGQQAVLFGTQATTAAAPAVAAPAPAAQNKSASTITVTSIVAAIVLLGAGGFAIRKRRMAKQ
jgi:hypothetical protein